MVNFFKKNRKKLAYVYNICIGEDFALYHKTVIFEN